MRAVCSKPCEHVRVACARIRRTRCDTIRSARGRGWRVDRCLIATTCSSSAGALGRGGGVLARPAGAAGARRREEAVPTRETCGDGLTPRAVRELHDRARRAAHRLPAVRRPAVDRPRRHPRARVAGASRLPPYGYVVRRRELDEMVVGQAVKAGATLWPAAEATDPSSRAASSRGHRPSQGERHAGAGPGSLPRRRRRRELPVRPRARRGARPLVPAGNGRAGLLPEPVPRRSLDREPPRPPRPRGQPPRGTDGSSRSATAP